jgi:NADPH:quinone reductase-like Zn-dependent oxidoreductase
VLILGASGSLGSAAVQIVEMVEDGKLVPVID